MKRFSDVKLIPREQITTDPKTFQGRQVKYAQETVNKIVREGFDKSQEPIIVWFDSIKNKYIVISGHSRWEASEILYKKGDKSLKNMPAKVFLGDKDEAIEYAVLESNRSGTEEGFKSDLKAFKIAKNKGYNHEKLLSLFKPESKLRTLQDLSYLSEDGKFLSYIGTDSEKSFPYIQRNAQWVGHLCKTFPALTSEHESEMFDYLYDSKKNILLTKQRFFDLIQKKVQSIDFNKTKPLNLKNIIAKNALTDPARAKVHVMHSEIDELIKDRAKKEELTVRAKEQGKTDLIVKFKKDIEGLNSLILRKMEDKRKMENQIANIEKQVTTDLFSQPDPKSKKKVIGASKKQIEASPKKEVRTGEDYSNFEVSREFRIIEPGDFSEIVKYKTAITEGLLILRGSKKVDGKKYSTGELEAVKRSIEYTIEKIKQFKKAHLSPVKAIWSKNLTEKQKISLAKGHALMQKAKEIQKQSGQKTLVMYNMPMQTALQFAARR